MLILQADYALTVPSIETLLYVPKTLSRHLVFADGGIDSFQ